MKLATCIGCGCDDWHACSGGCDWLRVDRARGWGVCSKCRDKVAAWDHGAIGAFIEAVGPVAPKIVVLCGSSRYVDVMAVCAWIIERDEKAIAMALHLLPIWYTANLPDDHIAEHEGVAAAMDELHLRKIDLAAEIFVVNRNDYVGDSTRREIAHAEANGKHIRWYTHDPVGEEAEGRIQAFLHRKTEVKQA